MSKLINFRDKFEKSNGYSLKKIISKDKPLLINLLSGGYSNSIIASNLGYTFAQNEIKTLLVDCNLSMGKLDILFGLTLEYNILHFFRKEKNLEEITTNINHENLFLIPSPSGVLEMESLDDKSKTYFKNEIENLKGYDAIIFSNHSRLGFPADDLSMLTDNRNGKNIVIANSSTFSIIDAYSIIKFLNVRKDIREIDILVNEKKPEEKGREVFRELTYVSDKFLNVNLNYISHLSKGRKIERSLRERKLFVEKYPFSKPSQDIKEISKKIIRRYQFR